MGGFGPSPRVQEFGVTPSADPNATASRLAEAARMKAALAKGNAAQGQFAAGGSALPKLPQAPGAPSAWQANSDANSAMAAARTNPAAAPAAAPAFAPMGASFTGGGGPSISNFAQADPRLTGAVDALSARTAQQQGKEGAVDPNLQTQVGRVGESLADDTTGRMVDRATSRARDQLVGIGRSAEGGIARAQGNNPFARGAVQSKLATAAARAGAGAAASIEMGERGRKDSMILGSQNIMAAPGQEKLVREGRTNDLTQAGVGAALAPANLALDQQKLGLEQWRAGDVSSRDTARLGVEAQQGNASTALAQRREQMDEFERLMRSSGY